MEAKVSEILENILSMLSLEGSFEVEEKDDGVFVSIETEEAGKVIGHQGETLAALQLLVNLIISKQVEEPKRVIIDVSNWRRNREDELADKAKQWAQKVIELKEEMALEPMPSWQRRVIHMTVEEIPGVHSESIGEGIDRHLVIIPGDASKKEDKEQE